MEHQLRKLKKSEQFTEEREREIKQVLEAHLIDYLGISFGVLL